MRWHVSYGFWLGMSSSDLRYIKKKCLQMIGVGVFEKNSTPYACFFLWFFISCTHSKPSGWCIDFVSFRPLQRCLQWKRDCNDWCSSQQDNVFGLHSVLSILSCPWRAAAKTLVSKIWAIRSRRATITVSYICMKWTGTKLKYPKISILQKLNILTLV